MPILPAENAPSTSDGMIVDLSQLAEPFLQMRDIAPALSADQEQRICAYAGLFDMSWNRISRRYDHWKEQDRAHDVYVPRDATDFREKAVIADTRAIADTVLPYSWPHSADATRCSASKASTQNPVSQPPSSNASCTNTCGRARRRVPALPSSSTTQSMTSHPHASRGTAAKTPTR